jgi:hypothetical protein
MTDDPRVLRAEIWRLRGALQKIRDVLPGSSRLRDICEVALKYSVTDASPGRDPPGVSDRCSGDRP